MSERRRPSCGAGDRIPDAHAGRLIVGKLDIDANPETAARFDVRSIPALLPFSDGRLVDRLVAVQSRAAIATRRQPLLARAAAG